MCINNGEYNKYLVLNAHEAIIDKVTFNDAQKMRRLKTKDIQLR